jgi:GSH-dependent disulfide-bond oxidoreductase
MTWFPSRWPPSSPDRLQLYSLATPNGQKIGIALEEMALEYDAHLIDIGNDDQFDDDYLKLSPNGKIPTLSDPHGPDGEQVLLMETGAILMYLADKTGKFLPTKTSARQQVIQWLFFQVAHVGPMFGQFGHFFKFARDKTQDPYALNRYLLESRRLLDVLDERLEEHEFIAGDTYSIADIATAPWVDVLDGFYAAGEALKLDEFEHLDRWRQAVVSRPAYQRGRKVCAREQG